MQRPSSDALAPCGGREGFCCGSEVQPRTPPRSSHPSLVFFCPPPVSPVPVVLLLRQQQALVGVENTIRELHGQVYSLKTSLDSEMGLRVQAVEVRKRRPAGGRRGPGVGPGFSSPLFLPLPKQRVVGLDFALSRSCVESTAPLQEPHISAPSCDVRLQGQQEAVAEVTRLIQQLEDSQASCKALTASAVTMQIDAARAESEMQLMNERCDQEKGKSGSWALSH